MIEKTQTQNELKLLATQVLNKYDIVPEMLTIIQGGSIKTVWKFRYQGKEYCLKRLKQTLDKVRFSVNAQIYIKNAGGNVPGVILAQNGEPITELNNQLFVVYEWLDGRDLIFSTPQHLSLALGGLAKFHVASKGFVANEDARVSTKLGKWPNQYESMKNKFIAWKELAQLQVAPQHKAYLQCVDSIIDLANQALERLENTKYRELTSPTSTVAVLCHQDYGKGNALLTDEGVIVIDLDSVTFDLPSRDLRKIIGKTSQNKNRWDTKNTLDIMNWYSNENPLTEEEKEVLYIDLLFPHWFYGLVKNQYLKNKNIKAFEIEKTTRLEISKIPIINELLERCEK